MLIDVHEAFELIKKGEFVCWNSTNTFTKKAWTLIILFNQLNFAGMKSEDVFFIVKTQYDLVTK